MIFLIIKTLITHYADAVRYLEYGWTIADTKNVVLNGKTYNEVTIVWDDVTGKNPVYPKGDTPPIFAP